MAGLIDKSVIDDFNIVSSRNKSLTGLDREARYLFAYCNIAATNDNYNQLKDEFGFFIKRRMEVFEYCLDQARYALAKYD